MSLWFLISVSPDYLIAVSEEMIEQTKDDTFKDYLAGLQGRKLFLPDRFCPSPVFLDAHYQKYLNQ